MLMVSPYPMVLHLLTYGHYVCCWSTCYSAGTLLQGKTYFLYARTLLEYLFFMLSFFCPEKLVFMLEHLFLHGTENQSLLIPVYYLMFGIVLHVQCIFRVLQCLKICHFIQLPNISGRAVVCSFDIRRAPDALFQYSHCSCPRPDRGVR